MWLFGLVVDLPHSGLLCHTVQLSHFAVEQRDGNAITPPLVGLTFDPTEAHIKETDFS